MPKVQLDGIQIEYDEQWSFKNFVNSSLPIVDENGETREITAKDLNGKTIYASNFYHEVPDTEVFPADMKGVTFVKCNLDNLVIPKGNKIIADRDPVRFCVQNDGDDWIVDEKWQPIKPVNWRYFVKKGLPVPSPKNIPAKYIKTERMSFTQYEEHFGDGKLKEWHMWKEIPAIVDSETFQSVKIAPTEAFDSEHLEIVRDVTEEINTNTKDELQKIPEGISAKLVKEEIVVVEGEAILNHFLEKARKKKFNL